MIHERTITLAIFRPEEPPRGGGFGWSLPDGDSQLSSEELLDLLGMVGINWAKFPVWYSGQDTERADHMAWFADRLNAQGIEMIGLLDQPPNDARDLFTGKGRLPVAQIFTESERWHPVLYPVLTRLSRKVRWWQLGRDDDISFVGHSGLLRKIAENQASAEND